MQGHTLKATHSQPHTHSHTATHSKLHTQCHTATHARPWLWLTVRAQSLFAEHRRDVAKRVDARRLHAVALARHTLHIVANALVDALPCAL